MKPCVLGPAEHHKVFWRVIKRVLINMMNMLIRKQRTAQCSGGNKAMLSDLPLIAPYVPIPIHNRRLPSTPIGAPPAAKPPLPLPLKVLKFSSAKFTSSRISRKNAIRARARLVTIPSAVPIRVPGRHIEIGATPLTCSPPPAKGIVPLGAATAARSNLHRLRAIQTILRILNHNHYLQVGV